ncbi:MAG: hypothetical protein NZ602_13380 [Thermoguttaceae bacterium]|nr:hypothetical protein [Thermoguttaceae bacterium]MDW8037161.1 hypothetical protein [Thermoguttaceae bacterium]
MRILLVSWGILIQIFIAHGAEETRRTATYRTAVTDARRWMSKRDLEQAAQALRLAQENARTEEEQQEVQRLEVLLEYLRQFWQLTIKGAQKLQAGQEIEVEVSRYKRIKVAVVEPVAGGLTLRVEGVNRLYRWESMPTEIVLALAKRALAKDNVSKVVLGAFLAVDEKGDRAQARKLWQEAQQAGLDVGPLLAELDAAEAAAKKPPPPKESELLEAETAVKQEYARAYARATTAPGKEELARKLLADAQKTTDPLKRFVMLREARDLAASACELRMASSAIEQMAQHHQVDIIQMKLQMLQMAAEQARSPLHYRDVTLLSLNLAEEALRNRRQADAQAALRLAKQTARNSKSRDLMLQTIAAEEKLLGTQQKKK